MFTEIQTVIDRRVHPKSGGCDPTYNSAVEAYRKFLLPRILPGAEWIVSKSQGASLTNIWKDEEMPGTPYIFDHGLHFRRKGSRGALTWEFAAAVGQPYDFPESDCAPIQWLAERGVVVWARKDLSIWNPGRTCLLVAARGLQSGDAFKFGRCSRT